MTFQIGAKLVIHGDGELDLRRSWPHVVRQRQTALPSRGNVGARQHLKDFAGGVVADRQGRDRGEVILALQPGLGFPVFHGNLTGLEHRVIASKVQRKAEAAVNWEPVGILDRRPARGRGIARSQREELHAASLDRRARTERPGGIDVALGVAVVARIGIDQDPAGSMLLGIEDLEPAEVAAIASQDDLVLHRDAQLLERREIFGARVIGINDLTRCVATGPVAVKGAEGIAAGGVLIGRQWCLVELQLLEHRPVDLKRRFAFRIIEQDLIRDQVGLPSPLLKAIADKNGRLVVGRRTGNVRLRGHGLEPLAGILGRRHRQGFGLGSEL